MPGKASFTYDTMNRSDSRSASQDEQNERSTESDQMIERHIENSKQSPSNEAKPNDESHNGNSQTQDCAIPEI
ncbi:hypothetical protein HAX54_050607 [Datura stramonium]|uniref:Uncharacterized protein n=1 Tax=Datura stramonium TaxID=4076 RepID=A0ABS8WNT0_DATST|nr:hypothetical protein [Datura stramonium]